MQRRAGAREYIPDRFSQSRAHRGLDLVRRLVFYAGFDFGANRRHNYCMCLICIELAKKRMTAHEARRAYTEMVTKIEPDHAQEVRQRIETAEREETDG